jgi:NAD binding domain of 6-phosphogluconate dehydrogenase
MQTIGFIGVGIMGGAIAARMMERGYSVLAYDKNAEVLDRLCAEGAARASSVRDVADQAEVVFACLPTPDISRAVATAGDGVAAGSAVKIYVDLSTLGGDAALEISEALKKKSIIYWTARWSVRPLRSRRGLWAFWPRVPGPRSTAFREFSSRSPGESSTWAQRSAERKWRRSWQTP